MKNKLQITNQTLIEECRKGDKEALNLFYLRFAPRMLSVIHRYIHDPQDAEDILHDGFIVGLTRLDSLRDADKAEVWLATIMKNLSLRFLQEQDLSEILVDIPEVEDAPEIDEILDLATLESLIAKLPAGSQKVFRLAILENKSHKEIGALLGIAPNSSSSQLFHAKLMMRKLIKDYKLQTDLATLLILALLIGIFIQNNHSSLPDTQERLIAGTTNENIKTPVDSVSTEFTTPEGITTVQNFFKEKRKPLQEETISLHTPTAPLQIGTDSVKKDTEKILEKANDYFAEDRDNNENADHHFTRSKASGWSLNVGADPGLLSFNSFSPANYDYSDGLPGMDNPENGDDTDKTAMSMPKTAGFLNYRDVAHSNSLPVSAVLTVSKKFNVIFSAETGVRYTYLHSQFETTSSRANCHWHYIGIPLKVNAMVHSSHRFKFYIGAGGSVDIPLYSTSVVSSKAALPDLQSGKFSSPTVWSLSGNLGVSIKLSRKVDLFIEPTLQYHFDHNYTIPNIWTDNKWTISLPLGIRFNM